MLIFFFKQVIKSNEKQILYNNAEARDYGIPASKIIIMLKVGLHVSTMGLEESSTIANY